jgi:hypothetical protein
MPATPGNAATRMSLVVADLRYSAYPAWEESGIPWPETFGAHGFFVRGTGAGVGGPAGVGRPSGTGGLGGGVANGMTPVAWGSAGGTDAGTGVPAGGAPRMTMVRVIGADGTDGRFDDRPALPLRGTAPPPPPRLTFSGRPPLIPTGPALSGTLPKVDAGGPASDVVTPTVRAACPLTSSAPGRGWCRLDFWSSSPKRPKMSRSGPIPRMACATAVPRTPGPTTIAPQANAQLNAALRIHTRSTLRPHDQRAAGPHFTTSH